MTLGCILAGGRSGTPRIVPEAKMQQFVIPAKNDPPLFEQPPQGIPGRLQNRHPINAKSGFWYSAPFTESLLVGLLAVHFGKRVEWHTNALKSPPPRGGRHHSQGVSPWLWDLRLFFFNSSSPARANLVDCPFKRSEN